MKIKVSRILLAAVLSCASVPAMALQGFSGTSIGQVTIHDFHGDLLVYLPTPMPNGEGCANNQFLVVERSHHSYREIYTALLAAHLAGRKVGGYIDRCNATFNAPRLIRLDVP